MNGSNSPAIVSRFGADAGVDDLAPQDYRAVDVVGHANLDTHVASFRELHGVADEVVQHLVQSPGVAIQQVRHGAIDQSDQLDTLLASRADQRRRPPARPPHGRPLRRARVRAAQP